MNKDRHEGFIFTNIATFMESDFVKEIDETKKYDITFVGIPHDVGVSYRRGAMFGPQAVREISMWEKLNGKQFFDTYSGEVINTNMYSICDFGDIFLSRSSIKEAHNQIYTTIKEIRKNSFPLIMGGDHSIAYSTIRGCIDSSGIAKEKIAILHIDAHCDTEEGCLGLHTYHHGAPFRLLIEEGHIIGKNLLQELSQYEAVYITLDVDSMNPAEIRGTGTPVEGGFYSYEIQELVRKLKYLNIIGFEMVELAPEFDPSGYSTIIASNIFWQFLAIGLILKK